MSPVLITGGAGFIGRNLAAAIAGGGRPVTVLDDLSSPNSSFDVGQLKGPLTTCVEGSILDTDLVSRLVASHSTVVHFAAIVGVEETIGNPLGTTQNIIGTLNVANALTGDHVAMFGSSADVYGAHSHHYGGQAMREDHLFVYEHAAVNRWVYPHVKALEENVIVNSAARRSVVIRFFNTYGPDMDYPAAKRVIPHFVGSILERRPIRLSKDGSQVRTFCYIDDTVAGLLLALEHLEGWHEANTACFNLGGDRPITIRASLMLELAIAENLLDAKLPVEMNAFDYSQPFDDSWDRVPDMRRARELLGFAAQVGLEDGLRKTLRHHWTRRFTGHSA